MKKVFIVLMTVFITTVLVAQEKTIMGEEIVSGGYGSCFTKIESLGGESCFSFGGQGAWMINNKLGIGGKGYGMISDLVINKEENIKLDFGCLGALLEYNFFPHEIISLNVHSMIGSGGIRFSQVDPQEANGDDEMILSEDRFFVLEPGIGIDLHVHDNFRIGLSVNYRFVDGVDYAQQTDIDINGVSAEIKLKFGSF